MLTNTARDFIIENSYDEKYGARPIKRFVSVGMLKLLIANMIIEDKIMYNSTITIDVENDKLKITN